MSNSEALKEGVRALRSVGLGEEHAFKYPHMLSGGQRQRVLIARALITDPEFVVLDEPTSMLDVSTQAQILNLLKRIREERNLTYMFITHNLAVARFISDTIAVMYAGEVVELAPKREVFENPLHPYTKTLMSAYPPPDPSYKWNPEIPGELAQNQDAPGCRYAQRCPVRREECTKTRPELVEYKPQHYVRCLLYRS